MRIEGDHSQTTVIGLYSFERPAGNYVPRSAWSGPLKTATMAPRSCSIVNGSFSIVAPSLRACGGINRCHDQVALLESSDSSLLRITGQLHIEADPLKHGAHQRSDSHLRIDDEGSLTHL
jgi:hypothetical protein